VSCASEQLTAASAAPSAGAANHAAPWTSVELRGIRDEG
jgi:hypothetical protein